MKPSRDIARLIGIMAALRTPGTGCPWDLDQDFASIAPYTVEEAYEVADAIARGDKADLRDELGDLLLQVVFHARMAEEEGSFAFPDVVEAITTKLIRRHPHVFGDARDLSPAEVKALWHRIKAEEKADRAAARAAAGLPPREEEEGVLAGVPHGMPALTRAWKLQARASTVGFDWNDARLVLDKIREEIGEVEEALDGGDKAQIHEEIGDLLFAVANLARHADADPEGCLAAANAKFERRFRGIEAALEAEGRTAKEASLDEMEALWQAAKQAEKLSK
ncbi:nucleoside triphosphate pyrophosphohydrolase [Bosea minatitlanensis]|uniref:Nucleoside triphosphate pyrophosphohydrolase n=1 Tax=Bosea minatitlanensis TaxID=128782 RepID=A0ABW0F5F0_9HYPH|nr:nucleoside triphosphate pyrophosphohydrolase [Bosea minatitlanensis]MCT4493705.1 nucleoside triphosphate pyrophosphohydrolase [Bosea minatitlanensis]